MQLLVVCVVQLSMLSDFPDRIPDLPLDDRPNTEHQSEVSCVHWTHVCTVFMYVHVNEKCA